MGRVSGKVAIVTGGASGMGASHVRKLMTEGAKVVFTDVATGEGDRKSTRLNSSHAR